MLWEGGSPVSSLHASTGALSAKQAQDKEICSVVKRQMEALEEKFQLQIKGVQQQNERSRDSAVERMNSKMSAVELMQPKTERRLAELGGNVRGLSDEVKSTNSRIMESDARFWEWQ